MSVFVLLLLVSSQLDVILGHGRLIVPPARSSAWREDKRFPAYYDDNQMYCGGSFQLRNNEGRCGICGENINGPKKFEKGGALYTGLSVRHYQRGQTIEVKVYLSANHLGWTEFRICNVDNMASDATQECLDKTLLQDLTGVTRIPILPNVYNFSTQLRLPPDLSCNHCVFQWKYHAGNSWNKDPATGTACLGCGPQEEFYGCADVTITDGAVPQTTQPVQTQTVAVPTTPTSVTATVTTTKSANNTIAVHVIPFEYETTPTYKFSKKVIYNPIANKIEIILYKNNASILNSIDLVTKRFEIVPNTKKHTMEPIPTTTPKIEASTSTAVTETTTITTTAATTTQPVNKEEQCFNGDGYYADLTSNCKEYYVCLFVGTPIARVIQLRCPDDLYFEPRLKICHLKESVVCDSQQ